MGFNAVNVISVLSSALLVRAISYNVFVYPTPLSLQVKAEPYKTLLLGSGFAGSVSERVCCLSNLSNFFEFSSMYFRFGQPRSECDAAGILCYRIVAPPPEQLHFFYHLKFYLLLNQRYHYL